jgi:hypothetical protein
MTRPVTHIGPDVPAGGSPAAPRAAAAPSRAPCPTQTFHLSKNIPAGGSDIPTHAAIPEPRTQSPKRFPSPSCGRCRGWGATSRGPR